MPAKNVRTNGWPVRAASAPKLSNAEWTLAAVPGLILIIMAILQLVSFTDFKDELTTMGISGSSFWGLLVIIAEFWGAAGFFKLRLSLGFRYVSYGLAIIASGFWFVNNLQAAANGTADRLTSSGYFGRYLPQAPGWWSVIEVSVLLFWIVYKVGLLRDRQ